MNGRPHPVTALTGPPVFLPVPGRWCVHGYYTLCPFAPDGSGRLLVAGAELETGEAEVFVLSADGQVLDRFGRQPVSPGFWHTGLWQSWSPDARYVYFQSGTLRQPATVRRELASGREVRVDGELEGMPASGEPGISGSHSMLYAAGYGDNTWRPELASVPFLERDRHGLWEISFAGGGESLVLSTRAVLDAHPDRQRLLEAEADLKSRLGPDEGLTLMLYCVRWNRQGTRLLFYFGNHCVVKERGEPRLSYVFTAERDLRNPRLALDLSFGRPGVHWGWQPDGETLIGYGPRVDGKPGICLAEVRYDGTNYRMLNGHKSGGHPSVNPADPDVIVSDEGGPHHGNVVFMSRKNPETVHREPLPKFHGDAEPPGRNPHRVCHHPVWNREGTRLLCNSLPGPEAALVAFNWNLSGAGA